MDVVFGFPENARKNSGILSSWIVSASWSILMLYPCLSQLTGVLVSFLTRFFDFTGNPVKTYPTVNLVHGGVLAIRVPFTWNTVKDVNI